MSTTEDKTVGWYHRLNGYEFEQAPGGGEGQGSLACYCPWGVQESDTTEELKNMSIQTCTQTFIADLTLLAKT